MKLPGVPIHDAAFKYVPSHSTDIRRRIQHEVMQRDDVMSILRRVASGLSTASDAAVLARHLGIEWKS
jgi:hypothetical protein